MPPIRKFQHVQKLPGTPFPVGSPGHRRYNVVDDARRRHWFNCGCIDSIVLGVARATVSRGRSMHALRGDVDVTVPGNIACRL